MVKKSECVSDSIKKVSQLNISDENNQSGEQVHPPVGGAEKITGFQ